VPIVFADVLRAIWALRHDRGFVVLALTVMILLAGGTVFYSVIEDLRPLDAAYFSVTTLATVGFGDFTPTTDAGKVFTAFFVMFGVGVLLALLAAIAGQLREQSLLHHPLAKLGSKANDPPPAEAPALPGFGDFDVLVLGTDGASRETALAAARLGLRVVVADGSHVRADRPPDAALSPTRPA
jgi:voltage-gated potassium channel